MMAWAVRTAGFFGLMAVWALVFAPGGDVAGSSDRLPVTGQDLTVEVLSPTLGPDGIWRNEPDRPGDAGAGTGTGTDDLVSPLLFASMTVVSLAVAAGPAALGRRRRSPGRPLLAYPTAHRRRGPPAIAFA